MKGAFWSADDLEAAVRALAAGDGSPCLGDERLLAFYDGRLTGDEEDAVRDHLASCPSCVELARDARRFLEARHAATAPEPPVSVADDAPVGGGWRQPVALAAGITLLASGLWLSPWYGRPPAPAGPASAAPAAAPGPEAPIARAQYTPSVSDELVWRDAGDGAAFAHAMTPYALDDFTETERRLAAYLQQRPGDARAQFYRGVCLLMLGRPEEAIPPLASAARAGGPLGTEARRYLARAQAPRRDRVKASP